MRCAWLPLLVMLATTSLVQAQDATALQAKYTALHQQLLSNQFQRPLYLESSESSSELKGDVYAVMEQPYAVVGPALQSINGWCDILILHINVKSCLASTSKTSATLSVNIGRKFDRPLTDAYLFEFLYQVAAKKSDYLQVVLSADKGPLSTSDYRILLEVVPLNTGRSFLHLSYSYDYGLMARVAMQSYLATRGRDKVGFSVVGTGADNQPVYIDGLRGVVERNTMRYYLAIEAYLGALSWPPSQQLDKRLNDWQASVEHYPQQLHELDSSEYLDMKHKEVLRQQTLKRDTVSLSE